jgi:hypothetical protein
MNEPRTVPSVAIDLLIAEREKFLTDSLPLYPIDPSEIEPCCLGVDVPGQGFVHSTECPVSPGWGYRWDSAGRLLPPALTKYLRELALAQLVFAARNLANSRLVMILEGPGTPLKAARCRDCNSVAIDARVVHALICNTGAVLALIDDLCSDKLNPNNPIEKEAAPADEPHAPESVRVGSDEETRRAGDGIRLSGNFGEPWRLQKMKGERGGLDLLEKDGTWFGGFCCMDKRQKAQLLRAVDCVNFMAGRDVPKAGA